jgi:hypothetical protein
VSLYHLYVLKIKKYTIKYIQTNKIKLTLFLSKEEHKNKPKSRRKNGKGEQQWKKKENTLMGPTKKL